MNNNKTTDTIEIANYKKKIKLIIENEMRKKRNIYKHEPTLLSNNSPESIKSRIEAHKIRQCDMKEGLIGQLIIGNFIGWENLEKGHISGLDCRKKDNSIIIEIKNKYNTCNSGSLDSIKNKLAKYKKNNPETRCVLGIINPSKKNNLLHKKILHKNQEIEIIQGEKLLKLVFTYNGTNYANDIINFTKHTMHSI